MIHAIAILLTGFSVFSALLIVLTHFRCDNYRSQWLAHIMGVVLVTALVGIQLIHYAYLQYDEGWIYSGFYHGLLFLVAPSFYLFSKPLLQASVHYHPIQWVHFVPVLLAFFLPHQWAFPLAFLIGTGYLLWLAKSIYALRAQRSRFQLEMAILSAVFVIAVLVVILGVALPLIPEKLFFALYAGSIGCAFLLVSLVLSYAPQLSNEVADAARETYAVSTLSSVDTKTALDELNRLMQVEHLYQHADLGLPMLSKELGLSTHQLSELINTQLGKGVSRYIREYRIEAAKQGLVNEPSASVLSIGMSVGFTSQSNFYAAFREIVGMTPGQYRKVSILTTDERG